MPLLHNSSVGFLTCNLVLHTQAPGGLLAQLLEELFGYFCRHSCQLLAGAEPDNLEKHGDQSAGGRQHFVLDFYKIVSLFSAKEQATMPAELSAQLLEELGEQTARCLSMQHQVAVKKAHTAVMQEGHNTFRNFFKFDRGLADEHAQDLAHTEREIEELKEDMIALIDDRDNLFADNEYLQGKLAACAE